MNAIKLGTRRAGPKGRGTDPRKLWEWTRIDVEAAARRLGTRVPAGCTAAYTNGLYAVQVYGDPAGPCHLGIHRYDRGCVFPWTDRQRIKNELVGPEREAVEILPPQSEVVDVAPMAWIWVLGPGERLGFGFGKAGR